MIIGTNWLTPSIINTSSAKKFTKKRVIKYNGDSFYLKFSEQHHNLSIRGFVSRDKHHCLPP